MGINEFFNVNYWYLISTWIVIFDLFERNGFRFFKSFLYSLLALDQVFYDTMDGFCVGNLLLIEAPEIIIGAMLIEPKI